MTEAYLGIGSKISDRTLKLEDVIRHAEILTLAER